VFSDSLFSASALGNLGNMAKRLELSANPFADHLRRRAQRHLCLYLRPFICHRKFVPNTSPNKTVVARSAQLR